MLVLAVHAIGHHQLAQSSQPTPLSFLSEDAAATVLRGGEEPRVVRLDTESSGQPRDPSRGLELDDLGAKPQAEGSPPKVGSVRKMFSIAVQHNVGGVGIKVRPPRCVDQPSPDGPRGRGGDDFIADEDRRPARVEPLRPPNHLRIIHVREPSLRSRSANERCVLYITPLRRLVLRNVAYRGPMTAAVGRDAGQVEFRRRH